MASRERYGGDYEPIPIGRAAGLLDFLNGLPKIMKTNAAIPVRSEIR
jgi:hypothetical protein